MTRSPGWTWRVFATCWLIYSVLWTPYLVREHFPSVSLVESGSLNVERYAGWTEDIFRRPAGGAYINNNPGASLTGAIPLVLFRPVLARVDRWNQTLPRELPPHHDGEMFWRTVAEGRAFYFLLVEFLTVALAMAPATAAAAAYLCARLAAAGVPAPYPAAAALLYGLGTPVLFRAAYLNHNLLVADAGLFALLLLWDKAERPLSAMRAAGAGLLAGYAVLCDYSGIVVVITAAWYTWVRSGRRWRVLAAFAAGVLPGVVALAAYLMWAFGSVYRPPQYYMPPTVPTAHGYRGFDWPSPALLWANFFDLRFGLFVYCPALLLAFAAPFARYRIPPREMRLLFLYFVLFSLFCAANQYSWLQPSTGFRYLVPVVPVLALPAMQAAQALPRAARLTVAVASCAQSLVIAAAHQTAPARAIGALRRNGGELLWMTRLRDAGAPLGRGLPWITVAVVLIALALIWRGAMPRAVHRSAAAALRP